MVAVVPQRDSVVHDQILKNSVEFLPAENDLLYVGQRASSVAIVALHKSGTHLVGRFMEQAGYPPVWNGYS